MEKKLEYPLYPELSDEGKEEAQKLIDSFKEKIKKAADETIEDLYTKMMPYIESDTWCNFRNEIMEGFKDYDNRKIQGKFDFRDIRKSILKNHREDIIEDLNQDMVLEIEKLKKDIVYLQNNRF